MTTNIVERVLEAFKTYELLAVKEDWGVECAGDGTFKVESNRCCCGLGSLLIGLSCTNPVTGDHFDQEDAAAYYLKVSNSYVSGFLNGFDGSDSMVSEADSEEDYNAGYSAGDASWKALLELGKSAGIDNIVAK